MDPTEFDPETNRLVANGTPEQLNPSATDDRGPAWSARIGLLIIGLLVGLVAGLTVAGTVSPAVTSSDPVTLDPPSAPSPGSAPPATTQTSTDLTTTTTDPPSSTVSSTARGWLRTSGDVNRLEGVVAVSEFPSSQGNTSVWILGSEDRVVYSERLPLYPGDFPYPLILANDLLVFSDLRAATGFDVTSGSLAPISYGSFLVAGADSGTIWVVGEGADWIAPFDTVLRVAGDRVDVSNTVQWPIAGVADGLLVSPFDQETYGNVAYWTPSTGLQKLGLDVAAGSYVVAASGDIAVFASDDDTITVSDIDSREILAEFAVDFGGTRIDGGCLSPQEFFVALIGSTGKVMVVSTEDGTVMQELEAANSYASVGWTTPAQMIALVDAELDTHLHAIDIFTGATFEIAELGSQNNSLATSGSTC